MYIETRATTKAQRLGTLDCTFIGKEGQTAHVLDGSTAKSFRFSMIRPAAAAQMHADEQAERPRADVITAIVALRSGTAEYAPLQKRLSDRN
jgi:hypothetical protein